MTRPQLDVRSVADDRVPNRSAEVDVAGRRFVSMARFGAALSALLPTSSLLSVPSVPANARPDVQVQDIARDWHGERNYAITPTARSMTR